MIQELALIVAGYVIFRMVEVLLLPKSRYRSHDSWVVACIFAVLLIAFTGLMSIAIVLTGTNLH